METLKDIPNTPTNFMFLKQRVLELAGRTTEQPPPLLDNVVGSKRLMYQSISSLTNQRRIFLKGRIPHPPAADTKKVRKTDALGRKIVLKSYPGGNYFQKSSKETQNMR